MDYELMKQGRDGYRRVSRRRVPKIAIVFTDPETAAPCCRSWITYNADSRWFWRAFEEAETLREVGPPRWKWCYVGMGPNLPRKDWSHCDIHWDYQPVGEGSR